MDIHTMGAWGELLGGISGTVAAFGVILTLLYLARQIHQNTDHVRAQVAHGLMTALRDQGIPVRESKETSEMYYRALAGLEDLTDSERWRFESINTGFFRVVEEVYLHHEAGRLEDPYWDSLCGQLKNVLGVPGIREDWERTGNNYNPEFREFAARLYARPTSTEAQ